MSQRLDDELKNLPGRGLAEALERLSANPRVRGCVTAERVFPAVEGRYADWPVWAPRELVDAYRARGIERPYLHQAEAACHAHAGRHVVVVTPTASGKTLCYNLPALAAILADPNARALYLFPTKALARDQVAELHELREEVRCFPFDGDTPDDARREIRRSGQIVVTNPDMLHQGILPHHTKWVKLFENLKYVVIDETHVYRGVFGSHVANVIRRLRRIAAFYRANPCFLFASATIANPREHAERLLGDPVELVDTDSAPRGERRFLFYNPPVVNPVYGIRANSLKRARNLALHFLDHGVRTIAFVTSRLSVEVLTTYLKEALEKRPDMVGRVRGYRGGYLPEKRREIERGLRDGAVLGVVSTNALELGIDIGGLDASVLCGYPGTIASTWQQAGRSGRRKGLSATVLVARATALDQYLITHPEFFFGASPEHARINPDNLLVLLSHVKCAAFELPFASGDRFGDTDLEELLAYLEEQGVVHRSADRWHWMSDSYPAQGVSLRSVVAENFVVCDASDRRRILGEVDYGSAAVTIHEGAVYIVEGEKYKVVRLDWKERRAYVEPAEDDYFTDALSYTRVTVLDVFESRDEALVRVEHGEVKVVEHVAGFKKIRFHTSENVGFGDVNLPDNEMHTTACWFTPPRGLQEDLAVSRSQYIDGLLGLAHVLHQVAQLHLMCERRDLGRAIGDKSANWHLKMSREAGEYLVETAEGPLGVERLEHFDPTIFLYDAYAGGIGFSEKLYELHGTLLARARELIAACACEIGCPSCTGPVDERSREAKGIALRILAGMGCPAPEGEAPAARPAAPAASPEEDDGEGEPA